MIRFRSFNHSACKTFFESAVGGLFETSRLYCSRESYSSEV